MVPLLWREGIVREFGIDMYTLLYLFIWLRWVLVAAHELSLVVVSRGYSS